MSAGQQAVIDNSRVIRTDNANAPDAVAWKDRILVFHSRPLSEVAEEFNRYNTRHIIIRDEEVGRRAMSGTYSVDRPQVLVLYLQEDSSLSVIAQKDGWIIRRQKN